MSQKIILAFFLAFSAFASTASAVKLDIAPAGISDFNNFLTEDLELNSYLDQIFNATAPRKGYPVGTGQRCSSFDGTLNGGASYYGDGTDGFVGQHTYCGTVFTSRGLTAALKQGQLTRSGAGSAFKCGSLAKVTNKANGKSVWVTLDDTGGLTRTRVIDLSLAAAKELDFVDEGVANVTVQVCEAN